MCGALLVHTKRGLTFMIRKLLGGLGVVVATTAAALVTAGSASAAPGVSQFCSDNGDFGVTHGGCVAAFGANNLTPAIADFCRDPQVQAAVTAKNHGECVTTLKELYSAV